MTTEVIVKPCGQGFYQWWHSGQGGAQRGSLEQLLAACDEPLQLTLLAPAEQCSLRCCAYDAAERKLLRQTLPYALEDELLSDVSELHFALGEPANGEVAVAVVAVETLAQWLAPFAERGVDVLKVLPEAALLPWLDGQWSLLIDGERWLLRSGASTTFAMEQPLALLLLQSLLTEQGEPESLVLYCNSDQRDVIKALLPEVLAKRVLWQQGDYWRTLHSVKLEHEPLNLLQGAFARSLPWRRWWQFWRTAAVLAVVVVVLQLTLNVVELKQLERRNLALRADIEQAYRSAVPTGPVLDAERQLRKKVSALKGGTSHSLVALLDQVGGQLAAVNGLNVEGLNYNGQRSELRLTLLAPSFNAVEQLRQGLEQQGLEAELVGSSASGSSTRARLKVRGRS